MSDALPGRKFHLGRKHQGACLAVRSGFRLHSRTAKSEASILIELTIKSARKLVVEPPVKAVWMELTAPKLWLVRPVKETECKVTDRVSHVMLVLTMSEGKAEKESDCCGTHVKRILTRRRRARRHRGACLDDSEYGVRSAVAKRHDVSCEAREKSWKRRRAERRCQETRCQL